MKIKTWHTPEDRVAGYQLQAQRQRCTGDPTISLVHLLVQRMTDATGLIPQLGSAGTSRVSDGGVEGFPLLVRDVIQGELLCAEQRQGGRETLIVDSEGPKTRRFWLLDDGHGETLRDALTCRHRTPGTDWLRLRQLPIVSAAVDRQGPCGS